MTPPHFIPAVIAPGKPKGAELLEDVFLGGAGFRGRQIRGNDIDRWFLREVFPACLSMPLEELRWAERARRGFQSI